MVHRILHLIGKDAPEEPARDDLLDRGVARDHRRETRAVTQRVVRARERDGRDGRDRGVGRRRRRRDARRRDGGSRRRARDRASRGDAELRRARREAAEGGDVADDAADDAADLGTGGREGGREGGRRASASEGPITMRSRKRGGLRGAARADAGARRARRVVGRRANTHRARRRGVVRGVVVMKLHHDDTCGMLARRCGAARGARASRGHSRSLRPSATGDHVSSRERPRGVRVVFLPRV